MAATSSRSEAGQVPKVRGLVFPARRRAAQAQLAGAQLAVDLLAVDLVAVDLVGRGEPEVPAGPRRRPSFERHAWLPITPV